MQDKKIVIVDDCKNQLLFLTLFVLEFAKFNVIFTTTSFNEALNYISNNKVDILITDFHLDSDKSKNGLELVKEVKKLSTLTKTILVSSAENYVEEKFLDAFIEKPLNKIVFTEKMHYLIG